MRPQPLIAVTDVQSSSRWYQRLLGCQSAHGGGEYERLVRNGSLILQLHSFDVEHDHGPIGDKKDTPYGNGDPNHWEIWLRDPDGYTVVLASPDGSADGDWKP
jgi:hypothetical protein